MKTTEFDCPHCKSIVIGRITDGATLDIVASVARPQPRVPPPRDEGRDLFGIGRPPTEGATLASVAAELFTRFVGEGAGSDGAADKAIEDAAVLVAALKRASTSDEDDERGHTPVWDYDSAEACDGCWWASAMRKDGTDPCPSCTIGQPSNFEEVGK